MSSVIKIYFGNRKAVVTNKVKKTLEKKKGVFLKTDSEEIPQGLFRWFASEPDVPAVYVLCNDPGNMLQKISREFLTIEAAGGLVFNDNQELLCIFRRGVWDLPKGKAEKGESSEETAFREVSEECGISQGLKVCGFLTHSYHTYQMEGKWVLKRTSWYLMQYSGETPPVPQTEEDITELRWVPQDELKDFFMESYPSLRQIIKVYLDKDA